MTYEEKEGYNAYWNGVGKASNPYPWSDESWWMVEAWDRGWDMGEEEDYDDD